MRCVVANALDVVAAKEQMNEAHDQRLIGAHVRDNFPAKGCIYSIDEFVLLSRGDC